MKKLLSLGLALAVMFVFSTSVFAIDSHMTVDEAKEYLQNYYEVKKTVDGKEYSIEYVFDSNEDLERVAKFLSENGLDAFNAKLDEKIQQIVSMESTIPAPQSTSPSTVYRTVSGEGRHAVEAETYGLASFDTLGTAEYRVKLGYQLTVTNGSFTDLTNIAFDIPTISAASSFGNIRVVDYCNATSAGVTANFDITKTLTIDPGFDVKAETDNEVFALLTNLA